MGPGDGDTSDLGVAEREIREILRLKGQRD